MALKMKKVFHFLKIYKNLNTEIDELSTVFFLRNTFLLLKRSDEFSKELVGSF